MTIVQLEYIVAVDTYRSFVLAAERCFVTQPTLSMQVQKLEDTLGVKIFDRSKQPVSPTEIGAEIIAQARIMLAESEKIKEIISDRQKEISQTSRHNFALCLLRNSMETPRKIRAQSNNINGK